MSWLSELLCLPPTQEEKEAAFGEGYKAGQEASTLEAIAHDFVGMIPLPTNELSACREAGFQKGFLNRGQDEEE